MQPSSRKIVVVVLSLGAMLAACNGDHAAPGAPAASSAPASTAAQAKAETGSRDIHDALLAQLANHRRIIVLLADDAKLAPATRQSASAIGQSLFHENLERRDRIGEQFARLLARSHLNMRAAPVSGPG